jgi:hypothetical protein
LGVLPNFNDPNPPLKSVTISLGIIFTTIGVIFGLGRLYANIRKLTLGDREYDSF